MSSTSIRCLPLDVLAEILIYLHGPGGGRAVIGRDRHEVHRAVYSDMAHKVSHEYEAALQNSDEDRILALEICRDAACLSPPPWRSISSSLISTPSMSLCICFYYLLSSISILNILSPIFRGKTLIHGKAEHGHYAFFIPQHGTGGIALSARSSPPQERGFSVFLAHPLPARTQYGRRCVWRYRQIVPHIFSHLKTISF